MSAYTYIGPKSRLWKPNVIYELDEPTTWDGLVITYYKFKGVDRQVSYEKLYLYFKPYTFHDKLMDFLDEE